MVISLFGTFRFLYPFHFHAPTPVMVISLFGTIRFSYPFYMPRLVIGISLLGTIWFPYPFHTPRPVMGISLLGTIRFVYPFHAPAPVMVISLLGTIQFSYLFHMPRLVICNVFAQSVSSEAPLQRNKTRCRTGSLGWLLDDELCIGRKYAGTIVKKNIYGFGYRNHIWRVNWEDGRISPQDCWPTRSLRPRWRFSKYVCLCRLNSMYGYTILRLIVAYE